MNGLSALSTRLSDPVAKNILSYLRQIVKRIAKRQNIEYNNANEFEWERSYEKRTLESLSRPIKR